MQLGNLRLDTEEPIDGLHGCLGALNALRARNGYLKILLSIGSWSPEDSQAFRRTAADREMRWNFCRSARALVDTYELAGIDSKPP